MPASLIPALGAIGGGVASGKSGKSAARNAQNLAQQQFNLQSNIANNALGDITPAQGYFKSLLSGDPRQIAAAVGPTSDILKQQAQAQSQQIAATTPQGGAQNLAQTQNLQNQYNQMSRLYAGVQPGAAQALAGLGAQQLGVAAPNVGSASKAFQNQAGAAQQKAGQLGQGAGQLLGQGLHSIKNGKNSPVPVNVNSPGGNIFGGNVPFPGVNGVVGAIPGYNPPGLPSGILSGIGSAGPPTGGF